MIQIPGGGNARIPAVFNLGFKPALHVLAQVINIFLSHAEFDIHEYDVVILTGIALGRGHDFDAMLLDGPDNGTTVHRITRQTIQFPANDAGGLASVESLHHGIEHWTSWVF